MAGTSIAQKLFIKEGHHVVLLNEPPGYRRALGGIPVNVTIEDKQGNPADLVQFFTTSQAELEKNLESLKASLKPGGMLWVTYPKGTSAIETDLNRDVVRANLESKGLKAVAMFSVDETWSAFRFRLV